ncbi:MAG: hypothetical protein IPP94_02075 [Ignavibacteria bacterium]|nr:hypothetical protein [Ignavibacteria bacterium]
MSALRRSTDGGRNGGYGFGLVFNSYRIRGSGITHIGAEAMYMGLGMQVGPSFLKNADGGTSTGVSVAGFYGVGIFAHAERTFLFDGGMVAGRARKLPIPIVGKLLDQAAEHGRSSDIRAVPWRTRRRAAPGAVEDATEFRQEDPHVTFP